MAGLVATVLIVGNLALAMVERGGISPAMAPAFAPPVAAASNASAAVCALTPGLCSYLPVASASRHDRVDPVGARLAAPGAQAGDLTCSDFTSQTEAQIVYDADPSDPFGLDVDLDGIACETPLVAPANRDDTPATPRPTLRDRLSRLTPGAGQDLDCADFVFQEDAQAVYDREPGDPYDLDPSGDGFACSVLPARSASIAPDTEGP